MAFDDQTRRRLFKTVTACRNLLTEDFDEQLRSRFGIYAEEGKVLELDRLTGLDDAGREVARVLRERIDHLSAGKGREALGEAVHRLRREQAFTVLNRFAAVRMAEERDLISQSVGAGMQSRGFRVFEQAVGSAALGDQYERYRVYLDCLFDELSLDLGVLFDRADAMGLLFPGEQALRDLFDELNHPDIAPLWTEDETIGWIYQYYNDPEERKRMRKESAAPRNSRELAVRNQFFTPRYVVEFLTDNTLGRIWYEMTKGQTRLTDQCRYLVRRPCEFFLSGPDTLYWHDAPGVEEFHEFDRTGDPAHLPENPTLGVALGWAESLRRGDVETTLARAGIDRDSMMKQVVEPVQAGNVPEDLVTINPALLVRALWYFREQYEHQQGPVYYKDPVEEDPVIDSIWKALRKQLQDPTEDLSQEELLKRPVFVPHRPIKDPREIRLLDPACGSMHFGLYAFDVFETIYEEAWERNLLLVTDFGGDTPPFTHEAVKKKGGMDEIYSYAGGGPCKAASARVVILKTPDSGDGLFHTGPYLAPPEYHFRTEIAREMSWVDFDYLEALASKWMSKEEGERLIRETDVFDHARIDPLPSDEIAERFRRDVPKLIIEHNIHGVDIDPRAVQIATLSLWLRAQKSWKDQGVRVADRPQVRRSNIVCSEPMPGSPEMLEDFVATLDPPLLGELVKTVFEKMQLAGEAGSLLKIEEEIRTAIDTARKEWLKKQEDLLTRKVGSQEEFFDTAEQQVIDALRAYSEQADADSYQRRLFADDAARGFAFIDLCHKRYDAVVMNPPFGDWSAPFKELARKAYPISANDILAAFVERGAQLINPSGFVGAITSRACFFLSSFIRWRESIALGLLRPRALADLGMGVMDDAMVEAAAYVLEKPLILENDHRELTAFRLGEMNEPERHLLKVIRSIYEGHACDILYLVQPDSFRQIPNAPFAYWIGDGIRRVFSEGLPFEQDGRTVKQGLATADDFRFLRAVWEVPIRFLGVTPSSSVEQFWFPLAKGGEFSPYYSDLSLRMNWSHDGAEVKAWVETLPGTNHWSRRVAAADYYFRPGLTYPRRLRRLAVMPLPEGSIISVRGSGIYGRPDELLRIAGLFSSSTFDFLVKCMLGRFGHPQFDNGTLCKTPVPSGFPESATALEEPTRTAIRIKRLQDTKNEVSHLFTFAALAQSSVTSLSVSSKQFNISHVEAVSRIESIQGEIDEIVYQLYGLDEAARLSISITQKLSGMTSDESETEDESEDQPVNLDTRSLVECLIAYTVGGTLGRWDIRYTTGALQPPPLPDPFDPLPVCPPGMLQNHEGFPAGPKDVPAEYPLRITWSGILVDEENHPEDIVARVREALRVIWSERTDDIEAEACEILGVKAKPKENLDALRVYFRDPNRFFKDHLARYSKSRRKAPIYWPLSTDSGSYTLWIYYHHLDSQTLYTCVSEFIDPKREALGRDLEVLGRRIGTGGSTEERQQLDELTTFLTELKTLRDRLLEVAGLPYRPNLNDGVQITAAPLWKCFRHGPLQKVLKDTWKELERGKYDWAHLALPIWSGRIVPLCAKDRSLAIAHGLEDLLWVPDLSGKKKDQLRPLKSPEDEIKELIKAGHDKKDVERAATDVQAAEALGVRGNLWVVQPEGAWRRRLSPKEEIENETKLRRGI